MLLFGVFGIKVGEEETGRNDHRERMGGTEDLI